ncbi:MAG: hypothetical protein M3Y33_08245 [Actinomycetota bacterium]|nr:hypothetical protein [Actinomycetota bacterium]
MPTFEWLPLFDREWRSLSREQQCAFRDAVAALAGDLREGAAFRKGLRVKKMQGREDVWEMTWAPDGRATFRFGSPVTEGEPHIVWRRIGTHRIFTRP